MKKGDEGSQAQPTAAVMEGKLKMTVNSVCVNTAVCLCAGR